MNSSYRIAAFKILSFLLIVGCYGGGDLPGLAPVTGVVTLDGEPLEHAEVFFIPLDGKGRTASAKTDDNGRFELQYNQSNAGGQLGQHAVTISKIEYDPARKDDVGKEILPKRYQANGTITVDVVSGKNDFQFALESK